MSDIEINLRNALDEYRQKRTSAGDLIEDIVDDLHVILDNQTNKWFERERIF